MFFGTIGASKLLSLGSIILKLFEANLWYSQVGNRKLLELAQSRGMFSLIEDKLKDDRGITTVLANIDYYLKFMYKSVEASLSVAGTKSIPTGGIFWKQVLAVTGQPSARGIAAAN